MDNSEYDHVGNEEFKCDNKLASYSCKRCDFKTDLKIILNTHNYNSCQKTDPFNEGNYMCINCNFTSYSILVSFIHQRSSKCNNRVKQHKVEATSDKNIGNSSSCNFCEYKSSTHNGLKEHCLIYHSDEMYKCNQCLFKTTRRMFLWRHIRGQHTDREHLVHFQCQHCPYKTIYKAHLKAHIVLYHTKPEEIVWHECSQCDYKAKIKQYLKAHIEEVHTAKANRKIYKCSQCSFRTICRSSIYIHKRKHSDFEPYKCTQCSYQTYRKSNLKSHINSRNAKTEEIKWFYCDQCDLKTKQKCHLMSHIAAKHSKGSRYKCDQCFYKTNDLTLLKNHRLTKHTDASEIDDVTVCSGRDERSGTTNILFNSGYVFLPCLAVCDKKQLLRNLTKDLSQRNLLINLKKGATFVIA